MRKILGAFVFAVALALAIGAFGALGNQIWMGGSGGGAWRTMSGDATMTNAGVITISAGAVGNSKLANASTTVNGQTCTLGASCTITAAATSLAVGTTTITSGTSGRVLFDSSGTLGELATLGSGSVFLTSDANVAFLDVAGQTVSGGAGVTSLSQSAGNITVDCTARPLQYIPNTGAFTITAPSTDGACDIDMENGSGAGAVTLSGFSPNTMGGVALDTTNGHNFRLTITRIHGHSNIFATALQ